MSKLNKYELGRYIENKYKEEFNESISPLKLQKSLYFLFGYWILQEKVKNEVDNEKEFIYLFDSNFQAWMYGPVEADVYDYTKRGINSTENDIGISRSIEFFLNETLEKIFKVSDFGLVNLSHKHLCWKDVYEEGKNNIISPESIKEAFLNMYNEDI